MKNPKKPTLKEKKILANAQKNPKDWYVIKKNRLFLVVVNKNEFRKNGSKAKTECIFIS